MTGRNRALVGGLVWLGFAAAVRPGPADSSWTHLLIAFAALVILPLLLDVLLGDSRTRLAGWLGTLQLPAAVLLAVSFYFPPGALAAFAALPWVAFTCMLTVLGLTATLIGGAARPLGRRCEDAGLIFACIGGLWVLADRIGLRPMKFDPVIVALTAAHFHYAGIVLPAFTGFVLERNPDSRFAARAAVGVVLGVPAVAAGITLNQLGLGTAVEMAAGIGLALAALVVAVFHVRLALGDGGAEEPRSRGAANIGMAARVLLAIAGVSLFFGMAFAATYALRFSALPLPRFDLATMRVLHGTVNAVGFGLCGVLGWRLVLRSGETHVEARGRRHQM